MRNMLPTLILLLLERIVLNKKTLDNNDVVVYLQNLVKDLRVENSYLKGRVEKGMDLITRMTPYIPPMRTEVPVVKG